ncbi:hypothetical protein SK128_001468 [Halocaridina rubra]|uniref:Uncharacterized protein n=1 Tax=Halocaridina rubra TaxID=373956 RepID=A0AAN9ABC2_HALRR
MNSIFSATLQKIAFLITSIRKSTVASPFLRSEGIILQIQDATKWNSQLKMVKSIIKNPEEVNSVIDPLSQKEQRSKNIKRVELSALKELVTVLEPFEEATEVVEGEKKEQKEQVLSYVKEMLEKQEDKDISRGK